MRQSLLILLLLSYIFSDAQKAPWAITAGNTSDQVSYGVINDYEGNSIIVGAFNGSNMDFDPSPTGVAALSTAGDNDIFVAKYNKAGQYVWAFRLGGAGRDSGERLMVDSVGNIYISGSFRGTVDFDPSTGGVANLTSNGDLGIDYGFGGDAFLAKFTKDGSYQWALNVGSSSVLDEGSTITIDRKGDILWTGSFTGTCDFDPSAGTFNLSSPGTTSTFLSKYSPAGGFKWAVAFGGPTVEKCAGRAIVVDSVGSIYLTGHYNGTIDLNPGTAVNNSTSKGCEDFFLVKLDSAAQYIWGFGIGGSGCEYPSNMATDKNNNLYVIGFYNATVDFNPGTANSYMTPKGGFDCFVAKYDPNGSYIFSKSIGSTTNDFIYGILVTDAGFTTAGSFTGTADFDPGAGTFNLTSAGGSDGFVARYTDAGEFENAFRIGGTWNDEARSLWASRENSIYLKSAAYPYNESIYVTGFFASSNVDFDPSPGKLLRSSNGGNDIFLVKYSDLELVNNIRGSVFLDKNSNGIKDITEPFCNNEQILSTKPGFDTIMTMTSDGQFGFAIDTGAYTTTVKPYQLYYNAVPASHSTNFSTFSNSDSVSFALQPVPGQRDLSINLIPLTRVRPGFMAGYKLVYQNIGTDTIASGTIQLLKDSRQMYNLATPSPNFLSADTIRWNYYNLRPGDQGSIGITLKVQPAPTVVIGDTLTNIATISPLANDLNPEDNISTLKQRVLGSYDPNDKTEIHAGLIKRARLQDEYLEYTIRFQNTGNDTAFDIVVRDTLSANVNPYTLQMVTASHNYKLLVKEGKYCEWTFSNIKLVDSFTNQALSHGYIVFRIKATTGLKDGDAISNRASIYFDYNPPVLTNSEYTFVEKITLPVKLMSFTAGRDGKQNLLDWSTATEENTKAFEIQRSATGREFSVIGTVAAEGTGSIARRYSFVDPSPLRSNNYYRLRMVDKDGKFAFSPVRKVNNSEAIEVSVYPNPVRDNLNIRINSDKEAYINMEIVDLLGKVLSTEKWTLKEGQILKKVNVSDLSSGTYFINLRSGDEQTSYRFQKQ